MNRKFPGEQKSLRRKKTISRFIFITVSLLIVLVVWFWKDITGTSRWNGQRRISLVVDASPIVLISLDMYNREAAILAIPVDSYLDVPFGYGPYKAGSVYKLGELDVKRGGGELLSETITDVFGAPIEGYIHKSDGSSIQIQTLEDFKTWRKQFFGLNNLVNLGGINTNLTLPELIRLYLSISSLRSDQFTFINLASENIVDKIILADGSGVLQIDPVKLDKTLEGLFNEKEMVKDHLSIAVMNATQEAGVGVKVARLIANMGGRVVMVGNFDKNISSRCLVKVASSFKDSYTVGRLLYVFGCGSIMEADANSQSDVTIVIGERYLK